MSINTNLTRVHFLKNKYPHALEHLSYFPFFTTKIPPEIFHSLAIKSYDLSVISTITLADNYSKSIFSFLFCQLLLRFDLV